MFEEVFGKRPDSLPGAIKPGLTRIRRAYDVLGQPGAATPTILVGGTNGKGSTAATLWQILSCWGKRAGLFTSPHLVHFHERFQINNPHRSIDDVAIREEVLDLKVKLGDDLYEELSFFEVATLVALCLFAKEKVQYNILEVGLGGRWDATNVVEPTMSLITSIGIDHQKFLGDTTMAIAREKAGIMRPGRLTLWSGCSDRKAHQVLEDCARAIKADFETVDATDKFFDRFVPEVGYQRTNIALAIEAARRLCPGASVESLDLKNAPAAYCLRGRCELLPSAFAGRDALVDVCHNPSGAQAFADSYAARWGRNAAVFVTISRDKDREGVADALRRVFDRIVFFGADYERCWRPMENEALPADCHWVPNLAQGVEEHATDQMLVVCGSVLGLGAVFRDSFL